MIAEAVYMLCMLTSFLCAFLLLRAYARGGVRLLLWSGLCFVGLFFNNLLLVADMVVFPAVDLSVWRVVPAAAGVALLCYGLISETA